MLSVDYLFDEKITSILLLKENHFNDVFYDKRVAVLNSIEECINHSNAIFVVEDEVLSQHTIAMIEIAAVKQEKKVFKAHNPLYFHSPEIKKNALLNLDYYTHPVIMCLSTSPISQHQYIEVMLNKVFKSRGIDVVQVFSYEMALFLNDLNKTKRLSNYLCQALCNYCLENENYIIIITISINNKSQLGYCLDNIRTLKPDFSILLTDARKENDELVCHILEHGAFTNVDFHIKSHYLFTHDQRIIYNNSGIYNGNNYFDIESKDLSKKLYNKIMSKIALPDGVLEI